MSRLKNNRQGWRECKYYGCNFKRKQEETHCKECMDIAKIMEAKK